MVRQEYIKFPERCYSQLIRLTGYQQNLRKNNQNFLIKLILSTTSKGMSSVIRQQTQSFKHTFQNTQNTQRQIWQKKMHIVNSQKFSIIGIKFNTCTTSSSSQWCLMSSQIQVLLEKKSTLRVTVMRSVRIRRLLMKNSLSQWSGLSSSSLQYQCSSQSRVTLWHDFLSIFVLSLEEFSSYLVSSMAFFQDASGK